MRELPIVKSCCGCCDLRMPCMVIAVLRLIMSGIFILGTILSIKEVGSDELNYLKTEKNTNTLFAVFVIVVMLVMISLCLNVLFSYWFIRGVKSKEPAKMKYYVHLCVANFILLLLSFNLLGWIAAAIEFYVLICSNSLYEQYLTERPGFTLNSMATNSGVGKTAAPYEPANSTVVDIQASAPPAYSTCVNMESLYPPIINDTATSEPTNIANNETSK